MKRWTTLAAIVGLAAVLGAAGYFGFRSAAPAEAETPEPPPTVAVSVCDVEKTVTAPGSLAAAREVTLDMPVEGRLAQVNVRAGEAVRAGQVLATLDDRQSYEEAVAAARLDVLAAQQKLEMLPGDARKEAAQLQIDLLAAQKDLDRYVRWLTYLTYPEETQDSIVRKARQALQAAEAVYERAQNELHEKSHLPPSHPNRRKAQEALDVAGLARDRALAELNHLLDDATEEAIVRARADVDLAQARVDEMARRLQALQSGPAELDRALLEGELAKARARLSSAEIALAGVEIKAPFAGVVLEVSAGAGETLAKGAPLLVLSDPQAMEVEAQVIEEDLPLVSVGQAAVVYFDAAPDAELHGRVARIVPRRLASDRPLYLVTVALDEIPAGLAAGMSADVSIVLERAAGVLCLPRAVVSAAAGSAAAVSVWNGRAVEERPVQVGLRGDTNVAILSGLKAGELVVAR